VTYDECMRFTVTIAPFIDESEDWLPACLHCWAHLTLNKRENAIENATRKPCCRKETARCRSYSYRFKVRQRHPLQV